MHKPREAVEHRQDGDGDGEDSARVQLALRADVEHAALEGQRDGQPGDDEGRGAHQHVLQIAGEEQQCASAQAQEGHVRLVRPGAVWRGDDAGLLPARRDHQPVARAPHDQAGFRRRRQLRADGRLHTLVGQQVLGVHRADDFELFVQRHQIGDASAVHQRHGERVLARGFSAAIQRGDRGHVGGLRRVQRDAGGLQQRQAFLEAAEPHDAVLLHLAHGLHQRGLRHSGQGGRGGQHRVNRLLWRGIAAPEGFRQIADDAALQWRERGHHRRELRQRIGPERLHVRDGLRDAGDGVIVQRLQRRNGRGDAARPLRRDLNHRAGALGQRAQVTLTERAALRFQPCRQRRDLPEVVWRDHVVHHQADGPFQQRTVGGAGDVQAALDAAAPAGDHHERDGDDQRGDHRQKRHERW